MPILLILCILCASHAFAQPFMAKVTRVVDGDTFYVTYKEQRIKIRLYGIDAPEKKQAYGEDATEFLKKHLLHKSVKIVPIHKDRYNRLVAIVSVESVSMQEILIQNGLAWVYPKYCKSKICEKWKILQQRAKDAKKGLWQTTAIPPWEWRRY